MNREGMAGIADIAAIRTSSPRSEGKALPRMNADQEWGRKLNE
jgi:hypothetical protein